MSQAADLLMEHTHRVYELDAVLNALEDLVSPLHPSKEQARRAHALAFLAGRIAEEAVGVVDQLMECDISWRSHVEEPIKPVVVAPKRKAVGK